MNRQLEQPAPGLQPGATIKKCLIVRSALMLQVQHNIGPMLTISPEGVRKSLASWFTCSENQTSKPAGPLPRGHAHFGGSSFFWGGAMMQYTKPPLSFEAQADLLISRGMDGDRALMIERLQVLRQEAER